MATLRLMPLAVEAGIGALDGYLAVQDVQAGRSDVYGGTPAGKNLLSQRSLLLELGGVAGGVVLGNMRYNPDITDPLINGGVALLGRRVGTHLARSQSPTPVASGTASGMFRAGAYMPALPAPSPIVRAPQYVSTRQLPRILS